MSNHPRFLVVIGASAGGLNALTELVRTLPVELDAAYCIVLHLSRKGIGDFVVHRLGKVTTMQCSMAVSGTAIQAANVYIARPNQHLLVKEGKLLLGSGPQENRFRPSIDVLFRSAAVNYTSHAVGIILSGMLDDGTSGMWAIKRSGGVCIVQDPNQAEYPDMPLSVINNMDVDHVCELGSIGTFLTQIADLERTSQISAPEDVVLESQSAEKTAVGIDVVEEIADKSVFACPDCGGNLWSIKGDIINRYRCHIGHSYTEGDLVVKQAETASATLWVALRMMEERKHLLRKLEVDFAQKGYTSLSLDHLERKDEMQRHIDTLKVILSDLQRNDEALAF
ncbi:chemotaxis protein CheB [Dyadobacter subterraneus]|uniref:protein-glutamate methylesterase n=1 Tax=Dyadobacter subterraneus TaxID=2773304 RepID=A0ABR9WCT2_9BACT|nr:chemotaxis protein CheB [Dyadobacter subterraneus]MBE9463286.1 chemotaxis protein CheB [Dyadobacter subterraneus]